MPDETRRPTTVGQTAGQSAELTWWGTYPICGRVRVGQTTTPTTVCGRLVIAASFHNWALLRPVTECPS